MKQKETLLDKHFTNEDAAREFLESKRWPDGAICPHCGVIGEAARLQARNGSRTHVRKGAWKCRACRKQFSVTVGTIFERSHIPLHKWLLAVHLMCASKKGMSAHQLHRMLGLTYKSAWFMAHRIRYAMTQEPLSSKLNGIVEVDETYVGGKLRVGSYAQPRHARPRDFKNPVSNKAAVVSVLQRGGRVQSKHVERVTGKNLKPIVRQMVDKSAHLMTDSSTILSFAKKEYRHDRVNHKAKEYVRYEDGVCITTNSVEGYFSILKRGINGVYHHVGKRHLHRYLSEFDFRYNARSISDQERRDLALGQVGGKRLKYKDSNAVAE